MPRITTTKRRHETTRLDNLETLVAEAGSASALARRARTSESYLSQIRNQLTTARGTPRGVGDELAIRLERAMGKPDGWMDEPHGPTGDQESASNAEDGPELRSLLPLISWVQAGEWTEIGNCFTPSDAEDLLPCPVRCSPDTFVLRVRGVSMEPRFRNGDLIFVDPHVDPISGRFVVVRLDDSQEATFKQLIIEEGRQYLKALNPDWPNPIIEADANATICGVVVFKGEVV